MNGILETTSYWLEGKSTDRNAHQCIIGMTITGKAR